MQADLVFVPGEGIVGDGRQVVGNQVTQLEGPLAFDQEVPVGGHGDHEHVEAGDLGLLGVDHVREGAADVQGHQGLGDLVGVLVVDDAILGEALFGDGAFEFFHVLAEQVRIPFLARL